MIDGYQPDLLYSDSPLPFGDVGRAMLAHFYNQDMEERRKAGSRVQLKKNPPMANGCATSNAAWRTASAPTLADRHLDRRLVLPDGQKYKRPRKSSQMLVDIVSKNGNLLINIVQTPEGDLEPDMLKTLDQIGVWIAVNGEGIYGTRPWKVYGEGPSTKVQEKGRYGGLKDVPSQRLRGGRLPLHGMQDGKTVYAFCMGTPRSEIRIVALGRNAKLAGKPVASVQALHSKEKLDWKQEDDALVVKLPTGLSASPATGFKISFEN